MTATAPVSMKGSFKHMPGNSAQAKWSSVSWMLPGEGTLPVITEPVRATVSLKVPGRASVFALDSSGKRATPVPVRVKGGTIEFDPAAARSIWCEVVVE